MKREQKVAVIEEIATQIKQSDAVFAVDYRGLSVPQAAELRTRLRDADASFRVVKNSLTERAADEAGAEALKQLLDGPTALTFVHGDAAPAAKAIADYARLTDLLPFKGGLLAGETMDADQLRAISRLPAREVLYGQLVGVVASPVSGLVRTLNALIAGLALQLGQINEQRQQAGETVPAEVPAGEAGPTEAPAGPTEAPPGDAPDQPEPESAPVENDDNAGASAEADGPAEAKE